MNYERSYSDRYSRDYDNDDLSSYTPYKRAYRGRRAEYQNLERESSNTHSVFIGYLAWIFGFMGAHRFYFGKPITGTIWFFTLGLFFIGWIVDFFLIPKMDSEADFQYEEGSIEYSLAWVLLFFLGWFGIHRFYMGKWGTGLIYLFTFGLLGLGVLYDYWTLNMQIDEIHHEEKRGRRY